MTKQLKITIYSPSTFDCKVYLDDKPLHCIQSINLDGPTDSITGTFYAKCLDEDTKGYLLDLGLTELN